MMLRSVVSEDDGVNSLPPDSFGVPYTDDAAFCRVCFHHLSSVDLITILLLVDNCSSSLIVVGYVTGLGCFVTFLINPFAVLVGVLTYSGLL